MNATTPYARRMAAAETTVLDRVRKHGGMSIFWMTQNQVRARAVDRLESRGVLVRCRKSPRDRYPWCVYRIAAGHSGRQHCETANRAALRPNDNGEPLRAGEPGDEILRRLRFSGVADYELDPGVCEDAAKEIERLRAWIRRSAKPAKNQNRQTT